MPTLSKKQVKAVKSIVVSYQAWEDAYSDYKAAQTVRTENSLKVWAKILLTDQETLGVEVVPKESLDANTQGWLYAYISMSGETYYTNDLTRALE